MGYDLSHFTDTIDDEFKCGICHSVLKNAVQSSKCEHVFCSECINEWLNHRNFCPHNCQSLTKTDLTPAPRIIRNLLNKLQIKCEFCE